MKRYGYPIAGLSAALIGIYALLNMMIPETFPTFLGFASLYLLIPFAILIITGGYVAFNLIGFGLGILVLIVSNGWTAGYNPYPYFLAYMLLVSIVDAAWIRDPRRIRDAKPETIDFETAKRVCKTGLDASNTVDYSAFFSSPRYKNISERFDGGTITSVVSGVEVDLSDVEVRMDCTLRCRALFGGVTITVPRHCRVELTGMPLLGGLSNRAPKLEAMDRALLKIEGLAIIGNIEIR